MKTGIEKAVAAAGSNRKLAQAIGCDRQLVDYWIKTGRPSPAYCQQIKESTGVPLAELRPDIWIKMGKA